MLAGLCNVIAGFLLSRFRHAVGAAADATHILDPSHVRVIAVRAPQRDSEGKHKVVMLTGAGAELPVTGISARQRESPEAEQQAPRLRANLCVCSFYHE